MALRIFRRKPENPDNPLPPPAGDRVDRPAGDRPDRPAQAGGWDESSTGTQALESQWRPEGGMTETHPQRSRTGGERTSVRRPVKRTTKGKSTAKGSKKPARRAKQATNRKPASKPAKRGKAGSRKR